jgi:hypothetical protein
VTNVLDIKAGREQVILDLTDFAEGLVDENGTLQVRNSKLIERSHHQARLIESVLSHNESLINRIDFWRGKAVYAFGFGLLLGSGAIAVTTLDAWQILDRALGALGWLA